MLDLLYLLCIAPIEFCMKLVLDSGYALTHSYGLALVAVSLVVNTAILPIYNKAEGWQEEERELKKRMAPREQMIRQSFRGQERFAMLSTLYRQFGYSPLLPLRASIGVLLQIPFFFAAYHLLSHMPALDGVSFGPIRNLGAPDGLLVIGGMTVNVLPLLMTVVNLVSAYFYTSGLSRRDKIQLYGMAALFLVLLYNSPAALTFYWTLNNIYSLGKNIIEKNLFRRQGWTLLARNLAERRGLLARKVTTLSAKITDLRVRFIYVIALIGGAALFMLVYALRRPWGYAYAMSAILFLVILFFAALRVFAKGVFARFSRIPVFQALVVLAAVLGGGLIVAKYGIEQGNYLKVLTRTLLLAVALFALWRARTVWGKVQDAVRPQRKALGDLYFSASALLAFLVFVYFPFMVFSTDPGVFDLSLDAFASARFGTFLVAMFFVALVGYLARPLRWMLGGIFTIMAVAALVFAFVLAPDVGVMDNFVFRDAEALDPWYFIEIDVLVIMASAALFLLAIYFSKIKILRNLMCATLAFLFVMSGVHFYTAQHILTSNISNAHESDANTALDDIRDFSVDNSATIEIPNYVKDFYTFSKKGKNIVMVMLDTFTGGNMNQLLEMYPHLRTELDGFTWYEDVVTAGSITMFGKPGIIGGEEAHPIKLNEDEDRSLEEKVSTTYGKFFRELEEHNFRFSVYDNDFFNPEIVTSYMAKPNDSYFIKDVSFFSMWPAALAYWEKKHNQKISTKKRSYNSFFSLLGLYNISPLMYKGKIYNGGVWHQTVYSDEAKKATAMHLAALELPLDASTVSDSDRNSFISIINGLPHVPWALDANLLPSSPGVWFESRDLSRFGLSEEHLRTEYLSLVVLIKWFDWMKKNGVYDNTLIILVSDHSAGDSAGVVKAWKGFPPVTSHGLLLVKEFDAHGELHIDRESLMANWDVPTIIRNGLGINDLSESFPWQNKSRQRIHVSGPLNKHKHGKNKYTFSSIYNIQGPIYNKGSWVRIK